MELQYSPLSIFKKFFGIIIFLLITHIVTLYLGYKFNNLYVRFIAKLFDFKEEANFPTLYSTLTLLLSSILLFHISRRTLSKKIPWVVLAFIFAFLGFDEMFSLHEKLGPILKNNFQIGGYFYYAWVIPYGIAVLILGAIYIPFILKLPKKISLLLIFSGVLFVSGAIGLELFEAKIHEAQGRNNLAYIVLYTIEETMEMLGIAIFIYGLLIYISEHIDSNLISIKLKPHQKKKQFNKPK